MSLLLTRTDAHPFTGMDVPWLLEQQALARRDHPFVVWAPFDGPAQSIGYGEFHQRVERIAGRENLLSGKLDLKTADPGTCASGGANLGWKIGERGDVVASKGRCVR